MALSFFGSFCLAFLGLLINLGGDDRVRRTIAKWSSSGRSRCLRPAARGSWRRWLHSRCRSSKEGDRADPPGAAGGLAFIIVTGRAEVARNGKRLARLGPGDVVANSPH